MVKETEFYERLEIEPTASADTIKRAYRRSAIKFHPDKNPTNPAAAERFQAISEAYEVLSDPQKREAYDRFGKAAFNESGGGASDMFAQFFGNPGFFGGAGYAAAAARKGREVVHELPVTLEDLYRGTTVNLSTTRNKICGTCEGAGVRSGGASKKCSRCDGKGVQITVRPIGPGMMQQMRSKCDACDGIGSTIKDGDQCTECAGKRVKAENKTLQACIDPGACHGQQIVFANEADELPGVEAADLIVLITEQKHGTFVRQGNDLHADITISLVEALTGFVASIKHLDDRVIMVRSEAGDVVKPDGMRMVAGEGMPLHKSHQRGNLYIRFHTKYPKRGCFTDAASRELEKLLPPRLWHPPHVGHANEAVLLTKDVQRRSMDDVEESHRNGAQCVHQ